MEIDINTEKSQEHRDRELSKTTTDEQETGLFQNLKLLDYTYTMGSEGLLILILGVEA